MHQSLHTLVEVGTGGIQDELLVSSARMFLPRVRLVSVWVPQSTVDPLCYPPNFAKDSVYSPGVCPSGMNSFLLPGFPKNLSTHFRGRSDIFRVDKRLHSHFEWKWNLDGLRDRFPMLPFVCFLFFRDGTVFPQSKIGPSLPLIHSGLTYRYYFSAYCFGAILSTPAYRPLCYWVRSL